ncbi:MAG TPA: RdgB/HAM1 family non-canonical purine NTP pyrophosphatase [Candidatus Acidoferrales bacterium]|nr:RdgB/HAM1 family non-canonical purine NTP pyrophosphatase [Candidatus Acidoferrales bacterium]
MPAASRLLLASSNRGKLEEFRELAAERGPAITFDLLPGFSALPAFDETAETIAENAAGKAIYYGRGVGEWVMADDSGLVAPALGGAPGVRSSRYAGPDGDAGKNIQKLLGALSGKTGAERQARFVCVLALARAGSVVAVFSAAVGGSILEAPRGSGGFGYDPVFLCEGTGKTFAELPRAEKNRLSHRGLAFAKLAAYLGDGSG